MFLCDCQTSKVWEIKPTGPNQKNGLGDTRCSGKQGLVKVLQDVSGGQAHPGQLQQAIYFLALKSLPQLLNG